MAVTAITTSGVARLPGGLAAYTLESLDRMFLYGESPCQIAYVQADGTATWASNARETMLASPGSGKQLYIWGFQAMSNNTGSPLGVVILQEGSGGTLPAITNVIGTCTIHSASAPNAAVITPVRHLLAAATVVSGVNSSAASALCRLRFYYCVV